MLAQASGAEGLAAGSGQAVEELRRIRNPLRPLRSLRRNPAATARPARTCLERTPSPGRGRSGLSFDFGWSSVGEPEPEVRIPRLACSSAVARMKDWGRSLPKFRAQWNVM